MIEQIGLPPEGVRFVQVCDRGADNFEVYCRCLLNRQDWLIRASRLNRVVLHESQEMALSEYLGLLPLAGTYRLSYRSKEHRPRQAQIEVRFGDVGWRNGNMRPANAWRRSRAC